MNSNLRTLTEISLITALAVLLGTIKVYQAPFGGSVSLVMVPIFLFSFRRGVRPALIAGALTGMIKIITDAYIVHPVQFLLDYPVAYLVLGFAGLVKIKRDSWSKTIITVSSGIFMAGSLRLLSHFISGVVWFASYAPDNMNPYFYSLIYNLYYLLPEMMISIAITIFIIKKVPKLIFLS